MPVPLPLPAKAGELGWRSPGTLDAASSATLKIITTLENQRTRKNRAVQNGDITTKVFLDAASSVILKIVTSFGESGNEKKKKAEHAACIRDNQCLWLWLLLQF